MPKPPFGLMSLVSSLLMSCATSSVSPGPAPAACRSLDAIENPLHDPARIVDMQVLMKRGLRGNVLGDKPQGVAIEVRPERGLTAEWLNHVLECDQAESHRSDASCLLALPGAAATVDSMQGQLVVRVRYSDPKIVKRAAELVDHFHDAQTQALARGM